MKNIFIVGSIICLLFISCGQKKDTSMSFNDNSIISRKPSTTFNKWNVMKGDMYVDTIKLYKENNSLRIKSSKKDNIKGIYVFYAFNLSEIEGNVISVKNSKLLKTDSIFIDLEESSKWKNFKVEATIDKESEWAVLYIIGEGDIDINLTNFQVRIDNTPLSEFINRVFAAENDHEFDEGSNIELPPLTPQITENLEILGKVWGFMKYYHPEVTQGKENWDYELFRILPEIANAENKDERSKLISKWIDKYGKLKDVTDYSIDDSTKYSRLIDLSWMENKNIFNDELIEKLQKIKNSKRSAKLNYYIPVTSIDPTQEYFDREKAYKNITWDDQGFRILTLFRFWNMIEYCFPYTDYTDSPWDSLLKDFLPEFVSPKDKSHYVLSILEVAANINDSHGYLNINKNAVKNTAIGPFYAKHDMPVCLTFTSEGSIVVQSTQSDFLNRGDVILSIEGKSVNDIIEEMKPYVIASNINGMIRNILPYLLSSNSDNLQVEIMRDGKKRTVEINYTKRNKESGTIKSWKNYKLESRNIIHVDNIKSAEENSEIIAKNIDSKGIIIDMREYPINNMEFLRPITSSIYPLWISKNEKSYPGNYRRSENKKVNISNLKPNYEGKIVILVDEHTQSAGETYSMMHRLAPNSIIVGRQTAGANGPVNKVYLPGNVFIQHTLNGAYYPNWEVLQRNGVKIDIHVSPTVNDIKEGRDVWIEKAIQLIEK